MPPPRAAGSIVPRPRNWHWVGCRRDIVGGYLAFLVAVSYLPIGPVSASESAAPVWRSNRRLRHERALRGHPGIGAFLMTGGMCFCRCSELRNWCQKIVLRSVTDGMWPGGSDSGWHRTDMRAQRGNFCY